MTTPRAWLPLLGVLAAAFTAGGCGGSHVPRIAADRILFVSDRAGTWALYSMNRKGGDQRPVVNDAGKVQPGQNGYASGVPKLSPDGRKVLLPRNGIALLTLATGKTRQLTSFNAGDEGSAVWSPDSRAIAYTGDAEKGIVVTDLRSGKTRQIVGKGSEPVSWSPDGKRLLLMRYFGDEKTRLWVVHADGTGLRAVTHWIPQGDVSWRSKTEVEFAGTPNWDYQAARLIRVALRSRKVTTVAKLAYPDAVVWSPDGRRFAYTAGGVYTMRANGHGRRLLTPRRVTPSDAQSLRWSPDGKSLVSVLYGQDDVYSPRNEGDEIWTMRADGSHQRRLTRPYPDGNENVVPLWTTGTVHTVAPAAAAQSHRAQGYVLKVPWLVGRLSASGARAVVLPHYTGDFHHTSQILVWRPGDHPLPLIGSFCEDILQPVLTTARLAIDCVTSRDFYGDISQSLLVFDLKTRAPSEVASESSGYGDAPTTNGGTKIDGPVLAGGRFEYETSVLNTRDTGKQTLWQVVGSSKHRQIRSSRELGTVVASTPTRLVLQLPDGRLALTTSSGKRLRVFDHSIKAPVLLAGTTLYEISGRRLKAWNTANGWLEWQREVPRHTELESGDDNVIVYAAGQSVYLASRSKQQRIHTGGFAAWPEKYTGEPRVHATLTADGLVYAYNIHVRGGVARGRVVFVPRSALLH